MSASVRPRQSRGQAQVSGFFFFVKAFLKENEWQHLSLITILLIIILDKLKKKVLKKAFLLVYGYDESFKISIMLVFE